MNRVHTEINRSIIFYRNQQGGSTPVEILDYQGNLSVALHRRLFVRSIWNSRSPQIQSFQNVSFASGVDLKSLSVVGSTFGEVVTGLALRVSGGCPIEVFVDSSFHCQKEGGLTPKTDDCPGFVCLVPALCLSDWECLLGARPNSEVQIEVMDKKVNDLNEFSRQQSPIAITYMQN